ncbi:MAG: DUF1559 domain-containing protein [Planctomycetaceae bacterium]|nr:DUF1559 domain-containing protein [Planctomycetaceae bacterium]
MDSPVIKWTLVFALVLVLVFVSAFSIQAVREAYRRKQVTENLKALSLSLRIYHETHPTMPNTEAPAMPSAVPDQANSDKQSNNEQ